VKESVLDLEKEIKCVVWDLDATLWHGTLLEDREISLKPGIESILEELDHRGILLSIASKNDREVAMEELRILGLAHFFLYPEIHWNSKSTSIARIQKNLNIGMDTILFIDDQPFERDEVLSEHPEVTCIDASAYDTLLDEPRLNPRYITEDSRRRRLLYVENIEREQDEESYEGPKEEFLAGLDMHFLIAEAGEKDLQRAEELTVRTNQLNTTGITYSYEELDAFRCSPDHWLLVGELTDCYGSYGKIGLALVERQPSCWHLKMLLMSCRVMARGLGNALLTYIMCEAKEQGVRLLADFRKTDRNRTMYIAYRFSNFRQLSEDVEGHITLENDLAKIQPHPPYLTVEVQ
jgi:FkbH-like protein